VRVLQETITAIDPVARRVTTDAGVHEADVLVVALGADYDLDATPGLAEAGNEFYSVAGAERLAELLPAFSSGRAVVGVCGAPYKCPPAPSEAALLLHDYLSTRGVRDTCAITLVTPFGTPVPPSPDTSEALLAAFAERGISFVAGRRVASLDGDRSVAVLDDGSELPFDLFLGVPRHRAPDVVIASGMTEEGYIPASPQTLQTRFPGVYAIGDVATVGVPKAGVFAEGAARVVAASLLATLRNGAQPTAYDGRGSCYIEFGSGRVGRVDIDFLSAAKPTGTFRGPSRTLVAETALRRQPTRPLVRPSLTRARSSCSSVGGKRDEKARAGAGTASDRHGSTHRLGQLLDDRKSEAGAQAAARAVAVVEVEALERAWEILGIHAGAAVLDDELPRVVRDRDLVAGGDRAQRVFDQVGEHLEQSVRVAGGRRRRWTFDP
jgi:sulfide:quinone oxidoreductase